MTISLMQRVLAHLATWKEMRWPPNNEVTHEMIKDFNVKKDILVIPKGLDVSKLAHQVKSLVSDWEAQGRVIRMNFIYTPAIVKSN